MADEPKAAPLTINLARPSASILDIVKPSARTNSYKLTIDSSTEGQLFIKLPDPDFPDWADFFDGFLSKDSFGKIGSSGAALIMSVRERLFALTFGTGRFLLSPEGWEERFGLRVALNCVPGDMLRSIDKHSLDQILRHSREQASREATPMEFGFDVEQDLLRAVTGKPKNSDYGQRITGSDSLQLTLPIRLPQLPELLNSLYDEFKSTSYRTKFPWVDQIGEVTDSTLQEQLENAVISAIASGQTARIWMAVPELISWNKVAGFYFPKKGHSAQYSDIHLGQFLDAVGGPSAVTASLLHARVVRCIDLDGTTLHQWTAHRCLYAEIDQGRELYILSGGKWYKVKSDFVAETNAAYDKIPNYEINLPEFMDPTEGKYLERVAGADPKHLLLMDRKLVSYGGGHSRIEFCDLLSADDDLLHVKPYGQSSALSHLFAQAAVSGELFQMDPEFRKEVNKHLPIGRKLQNPRVRPEQNQYRVVFLIISDRPGQLALPFFSRLNLRNAARRLEGYGFRVAKGVIRVNEPFSKTAKIRGKKKT